MPVTTTIARHYALRCLLIAIGSLVFGLWGVYDYMHAIPAREMQVERGNVCRLVMNALEPGRWDEHADEAKRIVREQLAAIHTEHFSAIEHRYASLESVGPEERHALEAEVQAAIDSIREKNQEQWLLALLLFDRALSEGEPTGDRLTGVHLLAYETADRGAQQVANVKPPRAYDRPIQWAFIACLPFFPLYLWFYINAKRRTYRLDDSATFHVDEPGMHEAWSADDIADIDMGSWMAKSVARVIHKDGRAVVLDDYKHKDLHLIIGAIASRLYPDQWTMEAKPVKRVTTSAEA